MTCSVDTDALSGQTSGFDSVINATRPLPPVQLP